jgi:hypothetical protein
MPEALTSDPAGTTSVQSERPRGKTEQAWFPLRFDLAEQQDFKKLVPLRKVILIDIFFQVGQHLSLYEKGWRLQPYYVEGDGKWADRLRVSVESFRAARYVMGQSVAGKSKKRGLGWFKYQPGYAARNGKLYRTEYHAAKYARVKKGEGVRCAAIDRHTWAVLISALKKGALDHVDLAVYLAVAYLWERYGGSIPGKDSITVPKAEIEPITGIKVAAFMKSLEQLSALGLFSFQIGKHGAKWTAEIADWRPILDVKGKAFANL